MFGTTAAIRIRYATAPLMAIDHPTQWEWQEISMPWEPARREEFYHWERASQWDKWLAEIIRLPARMALVDATAQLITPDQSWEDYSNRRYRQEMAFWESYCDSNMM